MANRRSEIELILTAKDQGATKTIRDHEKAVNDLADEHAKISKSFTSSEEKAEKLRKVLDQLTKAERDLISAGRQIQQFKGRQQALSKQEAATRKLIGAAKELRAELKKAESGSAGQAKLQQQFNKASVAAQKSRPFN
jgi:DNA repair ATPase RecN